jgi:pimeloyl-ACP methyl ester carboxylesterase
MSRLRTAAVLGVVAAGAGVVRARRRWDAADDPTGGAPLQLPLGEELTVRTPDGTKISVLDMGDRSLPPVVLAHGWTGDRRIWSAVARQLLAAGHRVVVYDQRGHGTSTVGTDGMTIEALSDDMRAVLEEIDAHDVVLAGHSMGGMSAQMLAVRHKDVVAERVASLVLVSTAASRASFADAFTRVALGVMASSVFHRAMALDAVGPLLVRSSHGKGISLTALDATRATWLATSPEARTGFLRSIAAFDITADLPQVTVPTIVLSGSRDTLLPTARSREIARLIPGARLAVFPGAGHQLPFELPVRLATILADAAPTRAASPAGGPAPDPVQPS